MQGQELKDKRVALGLTQVKLAEALGVSETFVGMMERGEKPIRTVTEHAMWCLAYEAKVAKIGDRKKCATNA